MEKSFNEGNDYSKVQLTFLVILRILIGWHLLFEGISKLINPYWSAAQYLNESQWIFSGIFKWMSSNSTILAIINISNQYGLILIGFALIVGLFSRYASIFGAVLLLLYYLANPPMIGLNYSLPTEGNYLIINKTLIEAVALAVLAVLPTSHLFGIDLVIARLRNIKNN